MKVSPKNIEYQEFLSIISGIKTIEKHTILLNYDDTIIGTIEQLKEFAKELENLDFKRFVFELDGKVNKEISDTEIKKYLKRLTDNFDVELTKSALFELEVFENMVFHETIDEVLQQKYLDEGWEIPTYETKNPITRKKVKICDYKKMRTKVFPFIGMQLYTAKKYLQDNIPPQQSQNQKPIPEPKETGLSEKIKKHFGFFNKNCPRKHKQILNDTDFEKLIEWAIWYFENDFTVPEISEPIKAVNTNKTFVQLAFKYLFKELHKSSPYPETLFEFYQSAFNPFSEDKKSNFEAVKNNDEVKKLMEIDY
jgi:hypothetical protein